LYTGGAVDSLQRLVASMCCAPAGAQCRVPSAATDCAVGVAAPLLACSACSSGRQPHMAGCVWQQQPSKSCLAGWPCWGAWWILTELYAVWLMGVAWVAVGCSAVWCGALRMCCCCWAS